MNTKALIWMSIFIFSAVFSWIGELIGHNWLSFWSIGLGFVGCFVGVWVGFKIGSV